LTSAGAGHKLDLVHRREGLEQSPSAKIFKKRPENSHAAGKKMTRGWLRELGEGGLSVVNLNERNTESLLSLGLYQLLNVRVSAIREDGQALPIPLAPSTIRVEA
jgi:hypothetical protein